MVALSHYCCRTTLQCQCHVSQAKEQSQYLSALFSGNTRQVRESIHRETLPKQHSFQFLTKGDQSKRIPDIGHPVMSVVSKGPVVETCQQIGGDALHILQHLKIMKVAKSTTSW